MPGPTLRAALEARGALARVVVPPAVGALLDALELVGTPASASFTDAATVTVETRLEFADLSLDPGGPAIPVDLALHGPEGSLTGFRLDLRPPDDCLTLPAAVRPAQLVNGVLEPTGAGRARLRGALTIRVEGAADGVATLRFLAPGAAADAVIALTVAPPAILIGDSGFGLELAAGLVLDDSPTEAPSAPASLPPDSPSPPSADPTWRGIAVRGARLHAPPSNRLLGGRPIEVAFELGNPAGLWGRARATLAAADGRPEITVAVEWDDPGGSSLADVLPTLVEAVAEIPVAGATATVPGAGAATVEGPAAITLRARYARDARAPTPTMTGSIAVEGAGPEGLAVIRGSGSAAGRTIVAAGAFATALMADASPAASPSGAAGGTTAALLLGVAGALGDALGDRSALVVNRVEAAVTSADARAPLRFCADYSAAVAIDPISLPPLQISVDPNVPLRVRARNVAVEYDPDAAGLDRVHLSYAEAEFAVEDPGCWTVSGPGDLFDVTGTRSGHGSTWFEVDLRFAVDLGPVKVSGATIRATFDGSGTPTVELRGLDARIALPGIIEGSGSTSLTEQGIDVALAATLVPLQVGALAFADYEDVDGVRKVLLGVGVDLPGPIPLANTGLGLYGFLGFFVANGALALPPGSDPVDQLLRWQPWERGAFRASTGNVTMGLGAIVGTVPDLGFAFSTKAVFAVTVPDVAVRASLQAKVLAPRLRFADIKAPIGGGVGLNLLGALAVDPSGVVIGLRADYTIPHLVRVVVPFGAGFPTSGRDWFVHLGADGVNGRGPGPIEALVLPGTLDLGGWAFLMVRGDGLADLGGIAAFDLDGFAVGFGFGIRATLGAVVVRLDLTASAVVGVGSDPLVLLGRGRLSGELVLGPVSLGVSAELDLQVGPRADDRWLRMEVCGEVDLFFFSLRGCVEIDVGNVNQEIPPPTSWPLQGLVLTDHRYGDAVAAAESPTGELPMVWPDAIPILQFSTGPANGLEPDTQFAPVLAGSGPGGWAGTIGGDGQFGSHDLRYTFRLTRLDLFELTSGGEMLVPPGPDASPAANGGLEAAWQLPKHGNPGSSNLPGARELALLTWEPHLWTRVLPDGGASLPDDPLAPIAEVCRLQPSAAPGWALGALATGGWSDEGAEARWTLPSEPDLVALATRYRSEFHACVEVTMLFDHVLSEAGLFEHDVPGAMRIGGTVVLDAGVDVADRSFGGGLALPHALASDVRDDPFVSWFGELPLHARIWFSEPLFDPLVAFEQAAREHPLARPTGVFGRRERPGEPPDEVPWEQVDGSGSPTGGDAQAWAPAEGESGPWTGVVIKYDARADLTLLGVRGVTVTAQTSASAASDAAAKAAEGLDQRRNDRPGAGRTLLKPDTRYRLVVGLQAVGERPGQAPVNFPEAASSLERSFYFRTADDSLPAPAGTPLTFSLLFGRRDEFDVRYLERYLLGYVPGDHADAWFTGDPVAVHFHADHIGQLARLYARKLILRCRRTDTPPGAPEPVQELTRVVPLLALHLTSAADRLLRTGTFPTAVALGGTCPLPPTGGASVVGEPLLAPNAAYDLAVAFPRTGPLVTDIDPDALRGITFTTSRWHDPNALLAGLGFGAGGGAPSTQVLDVPAVPPGRLVTGTGDDLVQAALRRFGLERWPAPASARTVALWTRAAEAGPWLLAGVLLEAPEPIHRPDVGGVARLTIGGLTCPGGAFGAPIRDAAGTRFLFPAAQPFAPAGALALRGAQQPFVVTGLPPAPTSFVVHASVAATPRFAEDL